MIMKMRMKKKKKMNSAMINNNDKLNNIDFLFIFYLIIVKSPFFQIKL